MDRDYRAPQDVARAGSDQVEQSLSKVLRRGVESKPFVARLRFDYDGGRAGPMIFIGNMSRAWSDYVNGNGRATDMVTGSCTSSRGEVGRMLLTLEVRGGRGEGGGNLLELNRHTRRFNLEVVYGDASEAAASGADGSADASDADAETSGDDTAPATDSETSADTPVAASTQGTSVSSEDTPVLRGDIDLFADEAPPPPAAPAAQPEAPAPDLKEGARAIKKQFQTFKAGPTAEGLSELNGLVAQWRDGLDLVPEMRDSETHQFVNKLATLLETKGEAFVAKRAGG
jgi:hypothetical protein